MRKNAYDVLRDFITGTIDLLDDWESRKLECPGIVTLLKQLRAELANTEKEATLAAFSHFYHGARVFRIHEDLADLAEFQAMDDSEDLVLMYVHFTHGMFLSDGVTLQEALLDLGANASHGCRQSRTCCD